MRFSLQDIKKQIQRRGSNLHLALHLLRPGELQSEIERLISYHEQLIGQTRRQFSTDDARACINDYRLAHCLVDTLSAWYQWQPASWSETLERMGSAAHTCLDEAGITSPIHLRLALFNYVNERHQGFLDTSARAETLQAFAASYRLGAAELEYLLVLDSDEEQILARGTPHPPTAGEVAALYNQWAFEAALFNASDVHFVIDCGAFENISDLEAQSISSKAMGTGIGAVIKRLCYLARLLGVYYDLSYDPSPSGLTPLLHLTLYGPQEMTGAPQQYGMRLARLCRLLLGYGTTRPQQKQQQHLKHLIHQTQSTKDIHEQGKQKKGAAGARILAGAIVEAEATVHFLQRSYRFVIDSSILSLLPSVETSPAQAASRDQPGQTAGTAASTVFDSSIEQSFAEAFTALENSQAVDGWKLVREPEPLLLDYSIFIPDFALTRSARRIYVEILGFWTPAYRERKIQKLRQLQGREDIVLAIPLEARDAFASVTASFPVVWYDGQLSATELLNLLRSRYDDFAERLASIDAAAVRERVAREDLLPERVCYEVLHCYRRSELPLAAERVTVMQDVVFTVGIGLYRLNWMKQLRTSFVEWIEGTGQLSLVDVLQEIRTRWPALAACEDSALEALLGLWPEVHIHRTSIFEATVGAQFIAPTITNDEKTNLPTKKPLREKRSLQKKRVVKEASQGDLWS